MNHPAKAPSAGSTTRQAAGLGRTGILAAFACAFAAFLGIGASAAVAQNPPAVTVTGSSEVGVTSARLEGEVNPEGEAGSEPTYWHFELSETGDPGEFFIYACGGEISGAEAEASVAVPVTCAAESLQPDHTYYVRLVADNAGFANHVESPAPYESFTTDPATVPALTAEASNELGYTLATLHGRVDPEGGNVNPIGGPLSINWQLQYSPKGEGAWNTAAEGEISGAEAEGSTPIAVEAELAPGTLQPGHEYEVRVFAYYLSFSREAQSAPISFQTLAATAPTPSIPVVSSVTASGAHFAATVNPNAPKAASELGGAGREEEDINAAYRTEWHFQCEPSCGSPSGTPLAADNTAGPVEADPSLEPNRTYRVKLFASNGAGQAESSSEAFRTEAIAPNVSTGGAKQINATTFSVGGTLNPHNSPTVYWFEYGTADCSANPCTSVPAAQNESAGSGAASTAVGHFLENLSLGTTYHYRLVARSAIGTVAGLDMTFTTPSSAGEEEACPNQEIREAQLATQLPECRAWEKTTPAEKGHGDIVGDGATNFASTDGEAIAFNTRTPFGDTVGSGVAGQTQYITRRSAAGWAVHAITPQPNPASYQTFFGTTLFLGYSDDLRNAMLWGYDFPSATGDIPLHNNIYIEDTASRALTPVTALQPGGLPNPLPDLELELSDPTNWGVSADARHVAFVSKAPYLPRVKLAREQGEQQGNVSNVYQSDDGVLSLVGILPDDTIPAKGSTVIGSETQAPVFSPEAMSDDGSRELFVSPPKGGLRQLYQRIDGDRTVWVSEPEEGVSGTPAGVKVLATTPDGRTVLFTTESGLLPEDTNGGTDLYRWSDRGAASGDGHLTRITPDGGFDNAQVVGVSDDGERVYYQTNSDSLAVWDHGVTHGITGGVLIPPHLSEQLAVDAWGPGLGRLTPDGRYFAFASRSSIAGVDFLGDVTNGHREMYLYDLDEETLKCISCPSGPVTSDVTVGADVTQGVIGYAMPGLRPRFLADDGKVFFSTAEALVPQDTNGVLDAYRYDPTTGSLSLLSSGRGSDPAAFVDASANGDNAFFVTRQPLLPSDTDNLVDLYDARARGGFPESTPLSQTPCSGEACQPPGASAPPPAAPSSTAPGRGNLKQRRHHKAKKHHRHHKHHKAHHRTAATNRRAGK